MTRGLAVSLCLCLPFGALGGPPPPAKAKLPAAPVAKKPAPPSPCTGVPIKFQEQIEAQGFLGLLTPDADGYVPVRAFNSAVEFNRDHPDAMQFRWDDLCRYAQEKKVKGLRIACKADTSEARGSVYYGSDYPAPGLTVACVISTFMGKDPDWDDLVAHKLIPVGKYDLLYYSNGQYGGFGEQYAAIRDPDERRRAYMKALEDATERWELFGPTGIPSARRPIANLPPEACVTDVRIGEPVRVEGVDPGRPTETIYRYHLNGEGAEIRPEVQPRDLPKVLPPATGQQLRLKFE